MTPSTFTGTAYPPRRLTRIKSKEKSAGIFILQPCAFLCILNISCGTFCAKNKTPCGSFYVLHPATCTVLRPEFLCAAVQTALHPAAICDIIKEKRIGGSTDEKTDFTFASCAPLRSGTGACGIGGRCVCGQNDPRADGRLRRLCGYSRHGRCGRAVLRLVHHRGSRRFARHAVCRGRDRGCALRCRFAAARGGRRAPGRRTAVCEKSLRRALRHRNGQGAAADAGAPAWEEPCGQERRHHAEKRVCHRHRLRHGAGAGS